MPLPTPSIFGCTAVELCNQVSLFVTSLESNAEMLQQVLVCNYTPTKIELKLNFTAGILLCHIFDELDCGLIVQLSVLNMSYYVHAHQDLNVSSASAEYPPLNLVIFWSRIRQNSFDAWAATAAETSAVMAAASWGPPVRFGIWLTLKVWFLSLAPRCGVRWAQSCWGANFVGHQNQHQTSDQVSVTCPQIKPVSGREKGWSCDS